MSVEQVKEAVTPEQKQALQMLGIVIEDMAKEWGPDYRGNWRWLHLRPELPPESPLALVDFGDIEYSEEAAYQAALRYARL